MRGSKLSLLLTYFLFIVFLYSGCIDALEPAGPAQYVNPDYPSDLFGYAAIPAQFTNAFYHLGRLYVLDRTNQMMISFSASDPNLANPDSITLKDTLQLGFPPGASCFDQNSETLFISHNVSNDIYRLLLSSSGPPELLYQCESLVTDVFAVNNGNSLVICFIGPEWLVRKINAVTGEVESEYATEWPITRAALSVNGEKLLLSNSGRKYLIEIDTGSFEKADSFPMPERVGPFLYNTSGNIVVFNQYTIHPRVYLLDGDNGSVMDVVECINPYKYCSLMPGTDVVIAPRRSDNRVSVLNTDNMIFAPSLFCFAYAEMAFSSTDNSYLFVLSDTPGRAYVYENSL
ncbi:MAG: hypothetical protein KAH54_10465 [Candidatus Sabulitectum sp.]|nr:hypothetical protein [Candidatus Sabulitectum sp.]